MYVEGFTGGSPAGGIDGAGKPPADGAFDGSGEWLPLVAVGRSAIEGTSLEEVLVLTGWPLTRPVPPGWTDARTSSQMDLRSGAGQARAPRPTVVQVYRA